MRQARRRAAEDLFAPLSEQDRKTLTNLLTIIDSQSG